MTSIGMTYEAWKAQFKKESYGQMPDGTGRRIFRMSLERDVDEGMRGYNGGSGSGDSPGHKQDFKGNEVAKTLTMEEAALYYGV